MIFRRGVAKVSRAAYDQVVERLKLVEEATRAQQLDAPQSFNAATLMTSTAAVAAALGDSDGVLFMEKLIFVKLHASEGGTVFARVLSAEEIREFRTTGEGRWLPKEVIARYFGALEGTGDSTRVLEAGGDASDGPAAAD